MEQFARVERFLGHETGQLTLTARLAKMRQTEVRTSGKDGIERESQYLKADSGQSNHQSEQKSDTHKVRGLLGARLATASLMKKALHSVNLLDSWSSINDTNYNMSADSDSRIVPSSSCL